MYTRAILAVALLSSLACALPWADEACDDLAAIGGFEIVYAIDATDPVPAPVVAEAAAILQRRATATGARCVAVEAVDQHVRLTAAGGSDPAALGASLARRGQVAFYAVARQPEHLHANARFAESPLPDGWSVADAALIAHSWRYGTPIAAARVVRAPASTARADLDAFVASRRGVLPDGVRVTWEHTDAGWLNVLLVEALGGPVRVTRAVPDTGPSHGNPHVAITLDDAGRTLFAALSAAHVGEHVAILLDDRVLSIPIVREPITGGRVHLDLGREVDAAREAPALAVALSESLPVDVTVRSVIVVGAQP